ncbi:MAG: bifunctional UDP-N-acetylglucosamine diphosphorylase/glucosamine-1-phosphate N-acetyltransferase GlmU [Bacillota bacterium]
MPEVRCVILAAGQGTRMKSNLPKAMHPLAGRPMVDYVVGAATAATGERPLVVVGYGRELVEAALAGRADFVVQKEQLGTGHAAAQAAEKLTGFRGTVVVLPCDTPLISPRTLADFIATHERAGAAVTVLTAALEDPSGYGRVIRSADGRVTAVVEDRDATPEQRAIREINTAIYCFDSQTLFAALPRLRRDNAQQEYYLPDVVELTLADGRPVHAYQAGDPDEVSGVNNRRQQAQAEAVVRRRTLDRLMDEGVTVVDPETTFIDDTVKIGPDVTVLPFTFISGESEVGPECRLGPAADIRDSRLGRECVVQYSVVEKSAVADRVTIGPFAHLRADNEVASDVRVGNYAEIKNSRVGPGTKISHHSYIGDADIGGEVNIGAGVVVVNFDGLRKHRTEIGEGAFIGCNNNLVAPMKVGPGAYTAAGSTLTKDVPADALAVSRERQQVHLAGWARRRREKANQEEP